MAPSDDVSATSSCQRSERQCHTAAASSHTSNHRSKRRRRWGPRIPQITPLYTFTPEEECQPRDNRSSNHFRDETRRRRDIRSLPYPSSSSNGFHRVAGGSRRFNHREPPHKASSTTVWPPVFEENGSHYVFDGHSGMFFEPKSNFFYDPKTRLYYGNEAKKYFRFEFAVSRFPNFVPVPESKDFGDGPLPLEMVNGCHKSNVAKSTPSRRKLKTEISIKIKTSSLSSTDAPVEASLCDKKRKENLDHIVKWQQRKSETCQRAKDAQTPAISALSVDIASTLPIPQTGGKVICVLCRRQFRSLEALARHEKLSQMHKDNLVKQAEADTANGSTPSTSEGMPAESQEALRYVDRAAKRRCLHYGVPDAPPSFKKSCSVITDESASSDGAMPALGEQNVGHQLLEKMKSKSSRNEVSSRVFTETYSGLTSEWNRIETLSSNTDPTHRLNVQQREKWGIGSL